MIRAERPEPQPLAALIREHRAHLRAELGYVPMTTRTVPSQVEPVVDPIFHDREWVACQWPRRDRLDSGELGGPSLSLAFSRYLDEKYGPAFPFAAALSVLRHHCRRGHVGHTDRKEWTGALCHRLVMTTVYWGFSVDVAARECGIDREHADRLLAAALREIGDTMAARRPLTSEHRSAELSPSEIAKLGCEVFRAAVRDFDLEQRKWEAFRHRDPSLRPWEVEWAERQAQLIEHRASCDRCRLGDAA